MVKISLSAVSLDCLSFSVYFWGLGWFSVGFEIHPHMKVIDQ